MTWFKVDDSFPDHPKVKSSDGHAVPCGCTHQPAAKGRKK